MGVGVGGGGGGGYGFMLRPPSTQMVNTITQKALGGSFSNLVHTVVMTVPRIDQLFMVPKVKVTTSQKLTLLVIS